MNKPFSKKLPTHTFAEVMMFARTFFERQHVAYSICKGEGLDKHIVEL